MTPRVSILVPLFNKAPFIQRSLESIAAQTYRDFEVIIVNDGSTDNGPEIAVAFPDARFRVLHQANAGPGAARNRGLTEAQGELTAFLDADDQWLPGYLETGIGLLDRWGPEIASVSSCWQEVPDVRHIPALWKSRGVPDQPFRLTPDFPAAQAVQFLAFMHPCCTVARTSILRQWGGFFDRNRCLYAEDAFLWLKVLLNHTVAFHSEPLVRIDTDASALSHHIRGKRPLEPFLEFPEDMERTCPLPLRPLLKQILAIRAAKTACVWGFAGYWKEARSLRKRFPGSWNQPYHWPSLVLSTRWGAGANGAIRSLLKVSGR